MVFWDSLYILIAVAIIVIILFWIKGALEKIINEEKKVKDTEKFKEEH